MKGGKLWQKMNKYKLLLPERIAYAKVAENRLICVNLKSSEPKLILQNLAFLLMEISEFLGMHK